MKETVHGLWIGKLGDIQQLSIRSFLKIGHPYHLWVYDLPKNIPKGTIIRDANEIFPKNMVFKHWSGNLATFADMFRYKLLYKYGGWWVDLDLVCLKPLPSHIKYFFGGERAKKTGAFKRPQPHTFWIGLMKFPKNDPILKVMYTDMTTKKKDFQIKSKKLQFNYGQTQLGKLLQDKYGDHFLYTQNKISVDLFNPLSYFDMIDFFYPKETKKCCKRWGWEEMNVDEIIQRSYTVHLYNKIILELSEKRGMESYLIKYLNNIVNN